jgi:hypothetical protein
MATNSPSSSPVKRPRPARRRFTLEEANRTLPLVGRIVRDIVAMHEEARQVHQQLESRPDAHVRAKLESELERKLSRLQSLVDELHQVGAELKDFRLGLVDFVSRHAGRDIYLCWKLGEESIQAWHELDAGFAGRQPISALKPA